MFLIKMRTKKGGGMNISRRPPGFPPGEIPIRRPIPPQRRIMPPQHRNPIQKAPREPREIDDVLKKLKDMSA